MASVLDDVLAQSLIAAQATTLELIGKATAGNQDRREKMADVQFGEIGIMEAKSAAEYAKAGENPRWQPQTAPAAA